MRIDAYLGRPEGAAAILDHARMLSRLSRLYAEIAPSQLAGLSAVANLRDGELVLHAAHIAAAARLRQILPRLKGEFTKRGIDITGIRVKVQAHDFPELACKPHAKSLSPGARATLGELAEVLPLGELRSALERLRRS